jgi:tight adherence protein B
VNNIVNVATFGSFVCAVIIGIMALVLADLRNHRPEALIRARVAALLPQEAINDLATDAVQAIIRSRNAGPSNESGVLVGWFRARIDRLRTVAPRGFPLVVVSGVAALLVALAIPLFTPLPLIVQVLMAIAFPVFAVMRVYRMLVDRFRSKFLAALPDAIDMIVRAVRAGIPVVQVLPLAGKESPEPLGGEFTRIGDSLQVGMDLEEVLSAAMKRIQIADFSFFCVCLLLQRETGGQLGETLENLAGIVRSRREIRQKTRALTAETRITVKILGAIPVVIMGVLYTTSRQYVSVLFTTPTGHTVLMSAVASIVLGVVVINKIANLDTSR